MHTHAMMPERCRQLPVETTQMGLRALTCATNDLREVVLSELLSNPKRDVLVHGREL